MKNQFNSSVFREVLKEHFKDNRICVGCGGTEKLNYHHIVPLQNGGSNRLTNITLLCNGCLDKVNMDRPQLGRPKLLDLENCEDILKEYFDIQIGTSQAQDLIKEQTGLDISTKVWLRLKNEFMLKYGIEDMRNNIDIYLGKGLKVDEQGLKLRKLGKMKCNSYGQTKYKR